MFTKQARKLLFFGAASLAATSVAYASPVVLDFEGLGDGASINNFYNGGTDSEGNSGPNYGVEFSGTTLAIIDQDAGGSGNFANEPSPDTIMFWLDSSSSIMNIPGGFDTGFSFFYASAAAASVDVYSGLNATGNILGTLNLTAQHTANGCTGDPTGTFCNWDPVGVSFTGTAYSIDFGGTANYTGYDDVTFGAALPGGGSSASVPEPATLALLSLGILGIGYQRRKRSKA